ncbi:MAG: hypothetical protein RIR25_660, partial [Verrucomicrobiota bacterium]
MCKANDVAAAVEVHVAEGKPELAAMMILTWTTCQRPPDIQRLQRRDLELSAGRAVDVKMAWHKTDRSREVYKLHTVLPPRWFAIVEDYIRTKQPDED